MRSFFSFSRFSLRSGFCALAVAAIVPFVVAPVPAFAQIVVFNNGAPDNVTGYYSDPDDAQLCADTFTFNSATSFNTVRWFGYYNPSHTPLDDHFTISFYDTTAGVPDATALPNRTYTFGANANRTATGSAIFGSPVYSYSSSLAGDVTLGPGTYGISIVNDTRNDTDDNWIWATSNQTGTFYSRGNESQPYFTVQFPGDLAFSLVSDPQAAAPEPGSLVLLGTGFIGAGGMAGFRRRQKNAAGK